MADDVKPALTAEEWRIRCAERAGKPGDAGFVAVRSPRMQCVAIGGTATNTGDFYLFRDDCHAVAALALDGQPFGFSWEMQDAIQYCVARCASLKGNEADRRYREMARQACDRIAGLLPPRDPSPADS